MNTSVLAFGHLPKFHGGRQQSGLANAMWEIATNMADSNTGFRVDFCATDVFSKSTCVGGLTVIGWTKTSLLIGILREPVRSVGLVNRLIGPCIRYRLPLFRTVLRALHLQQALLLARPDFLHLHGCESVALLESDVFDPARTIVTLHGVHGDVGQDSLHFMEKSLSSFPFRSLTFISVKNAKEWHELYGPPAALSAIIPNSFDRSSFYLPECGNSMKGGKKDSFRLVSVGSINNNKGQNRVIAAMARLKDSGSHHLVEYVMIGNGDPEQVTDLLRQASEAGVRVTHLPYLSPLNLREQLVKADFMILASEKEGFGLVFLESIACGVPVVLPKHLPICDEPDLISDANAVLLESASVDAVLAFLAELPTHCFFGTTVAESLPDGSWQEIGARYRALLA